ncbi:MAG: helix-turn-helix domain-containing protein [Huintestinicola sp.]
MEKFEILSEALEYIEDNLTSGVTPNQCAEKCRYSLSNLQKMFSCTFHIGISDYISRRRLTNAAKDLLLTDNTVLETALKYGYNSHEVFTRAFVRLWGVTPAKFRKSSGFSEIYPKLGRYNELFDEKGNEVMASKIRFDVSHLYDYIKEHRGKYAICFDMCHLMYINDTYGSAAGDIAIAECLRRIDDAAEDNMLTIRIGGDEFVLITDYSDKSSAEAVAEKILALNGRTVRSGENEFEVSLRAGFTVIPEKGNLRYNELFDSFIIAGRQD